MIKYIGSKRALIPWILNTVRTVASGASVRTVTDLFSGTARVGHALKGAGYNVVANDVTTYAWVLATALVAADRTLYPPERVGPILDRLNALDGRPGFFTRTYCEVARFFHPKNGARIDAIRAAIEEEAAGDPHLRAILLTSLMLAADRVDSTTGVQMAYLKQWAPRALNDLHLEYPSLLPGGGVAVQADAVEYALDVESDLVYLDPPYNQHAYLSNYHIWETLVLAGEPETYGVAQKRLDCVTRKSPFNSRRQALVSMAALLERLRSPHVLVSFSNEGFIAKDDMLALLARWRYTVCLARPHRRYVGALIGIHNPAGEKVGRVSHTTNKEYLFVATNSRAVYDAVRARELDTAEESHLALL